MDPDPIAVLMSSRDHAAHCLYLALPEAAQRVVREVAEMARTYGIAPEADDDHCM